MKLGDGTFAQWANYPGWSFIASIFIKLTRSFVSESAVWMVIKHLIHLLDHSLKLALR